MSNDFHQHLADLDAAVDDSRKPGWVPGDPCTDEALAISGVGPNLLTLLAEAQRAHLALAALLEDLDAIWCNPDHRRRFVNDEEVMAAGRPCDIAVLRQQFTAANEYVRGCDKAEMWLSSQIALAVEIQTIPDVRAMLWRFKRAVRKVLEPPPSLELVREDLAEVTHALGPEFAESRKAWARLWSETWHVLEGSIRLEKGEPELIASLVMWLRASVAYLHVGYVPARVLRDCYRALIEEASQEAASTSTGPTHAEAGSGDDEALGDGTGSHAQSAFRFERDVAVWRIQFEEESGSISAGQYDGLEYIARILAAPNEELAADQLYRTKAATVTCSPDYVFADQLYRTKAATETCSANHAFDDEGVSAIEKRAIRLKEEIEDARQGNAWARQKEAEEALDDLVKSHQKDMNKQGKPRRINRSAAEKAADCVRKAIGQVLKALARDLPKLTTHLKKHIKKEKTSFFYQIPKPPAWQIVL